MYQLHDSFAGQFNMHGITIPNNPYFRKSGELAEKNKMDASVINCQVR
jgi:hypothetical protein